MRRNRESAAASRKRTKEYIEELEGKVLALESTVQALQAAMVNHLWRLKAKAHLVNVPVHLCACAAFRVPVPESLPRQSVDLCSGRSLCEPVSGPAPLR